MHGRAAAVVIELDSAPASLNHLTSGDYSERCVVSALHRPVLELSRATAEHDRFEFKVADAQYFSDGTRVRAEHVVRTLVAAASSPMWARFIGYLQKAEVAGDVVCLTMRQPASFLPAMLAVVDFSPTHPDGRVGNGPYRLTDVGAVDGRYHLTPNPCFPGAADRPDLVFSIQPDVDGAPDRFSRGAADITCSTAFPLHRLADWRGGEALHRAPTGIHMQLEPNPAGPAEVAEPSVWTALRDCLDRTAIAAAFSGGLRPVAVGRDAPRRPGGPLPADLRISYHDFYPNRQVLERIAGQWRQRLGVRTELVERDYADFSRAEVDACFALRYSVFNHPFAFYAQCSALARDPVLDGLLHRLAADEPGALDAVRRRVGDTVPVLRLFEVIGHWLVQPGITGFSWPTDAAFDFTRLRRAGRR